MPPVVGLTALFLPCSNQQVESEFTTTKCDHKNTTNVITFNQGITDFFGSGVQCLGQYGDVLQSFWV